MFVGHFAIAFLLWRLFPQVPLPVVLIAVSFPDLLWSLLVPAGIEKVRINPDSPLQKFIVFEKFPYSHSLGFDGDRKVGAGLWKRGQLAFAVEYAFYAIVTTLALSGFPLVYALIIGGVFHAINLPSFLGSNRKNSVKSSNGYAILALVGFGTFILVASLAI